MDRRLLILIASGLALASPAIAEVDPKIHKLCSEAKDYLGCVKAMNGETEDKRTVIQETFDAGKRVSGNSCPHTYAYFGAGWCRQVYCTLGLGFGKHDPSLAGKGMSCPSGQVLRWTTTAGKAVQATIDPNCPDEQLEIGWQSTCQLATWDIYAPFKNKDGTWK